MYDATDKKLVTALREHSARRLHEYAALTGIPKSTVHERMHKLQRSGLRCVPLVHWHALGQPITVCFFLPYVETVLEHPSINTAQRLAPNLLFLECIFPSLAAYEAFRQLYPSAKGYFVLNVLRRESFVPPL
jgi:DNA-binding Lrp family transcriptional regulator